jgi:hypothetical protein
MRDLGLITIADWTPSGISNFIMLAGSAAQITDFDGWMLRNWWYELSRNRGWRSNTTPPTTTTARPPTTTTPPPSNGGQAQQYGQCDGVGWTGPTQCVSPYTCTKQNDWYSQCL